MSSKTIKLTRLFTVLVLAVASGCSSDPRTLNLTISDTSNALRVCNAEVSIGGVEAVATGENEGCRYEWTEPESAESTALEVAHVGYASLSDDTFDVDEAFETSTTVDVAVTPSNTYADRFVGTLFFDFQGVFGPGSILLLHIDDDGFLNLDNTFDGGLTWNRDYYNLSTEPIVVDEDDKELSMDASFVTAATGKPDTGLQPGDSVVDLSIWEMPCDDARMGDYTSHSDSLYHCFAMCVMGATEICAGDELIAFGGQCSKIASDAAGCAALYAAEPTIEGVADGANFGEGRPISGSESETHAPPVERP